MPEQNNATANSPWTLPAEPEKWGALDLKQIAAALPPPGEYPARIAQVRLSDKGTTLWMTVRFSLEGQCHAPAAETVAIAARPGSEHEHRVPDGARLLHRLIAATGLDASQIGDPFKLPELFEGRKLTATVAHKARDGVPELIVRAIRPRT